MPTTSFRSVDTFHKSQNKPVKFAGTLIPAEKLKSFQDAVYQNNPEKACEMVRNGEIQVNGEIGKPIHGEPRPTLFEWILGYVDSQFRYIELLREMVRAGGNLQKQDGFGLFPVHKVATLWSPDALQILVDGGADVNQPDRQYGLTALHTASMWGWPEMVNALIERNANIEAKSPVNSQTPLFTVIRKGQYSHVPIIAALLDKGALTNITDASGRVPLEFALERAESLSEEALWSGQPITITYNLPAIVDLLLAHGAVFPNEQARERYITLLKTPAYNAFFKALPYEAVKRHVQHDLPHPDEPRPLNQEFPDTEDHRNYRKAVLEVFREGVRQQGPSHPLYHLYGRKHKNHSNS